MCGIVGLISASSDGSGLAAIKSLNFKIKHRGPDSDDYWASSCGRIHLGHSRLSVLDLSTASLQPMKSRCGRYVIVFNGEIYNFNEIREILISKGRDFNSTGDTEVVLTAYMEWGQDCVQYFNGMFAFAIVDQGNSQVEPSVYFARDRAGEKPLYYTADFYGLQFASELKALRHKKTINLKALNHYLALGYVPYDQCLFDGVKKLPPAHCARYDINKREIHIWKYWSLPQNSSSANADGHELAAEAGRLIEDSVRMRLLADVPVGVLLSGGLDSSLVAAAAARVSSKPVQTFTIALPGSPLDEAHHAQKVANYLGTEHHVLELSKPSLSLLDGLASYIDEPIADSSILPAWMVFGLARKQVTVALGGDGGDELFGGYTDYRTSLADQNRWGFCPRFLYKATAKIATQLPAGVKGRNRLSSMRGGPLQQMIWGGPYFDEQLRKRILSKDAWVQLSESETEPEEFLLSLFNSGTTDMDKMTRMHFRSVLPDDFLIKVDRASMAHSLEVRAPMLDYRLIEFCFSQVPDQWKVKDGESRRLQRILAERWLPPDLDTKRKQGFSIPINEWLRAEGVAKLMARMEALPDVINMDEVRSLVRGHVAGRANGGRLFALIMLAIAMQNILT
jgi:asparagine synthase (glutamine-hydrolysing)